MLYINKKKTIFSFIDEFNNKLKITFCELIFIYLIGFLHLKGK